MTRKCFFVEEVDLSEEYVIFTKETARHLNNVLRLKAGDAIELRDGRGNGWTAVVAETGRGFVRVQLKEQQQLENESSLDITLAMAFARSDRMELVLRQATEIGVRRFVAFRAQRSQYGLSGHDVTKRMQRWSMIAREALCQCGRDRLPDLMVVGDVNEFIAAAAGWWDHAGDPSLKIVACETERKKSLLDLKRALPACGHIVAVVGTEGGWTDWEVDVLINADYHTVHLGPRILRLETAAVTLLSSVQLLWGDIGGTSDKGVEGNEML